MTSTYIAGTGVWTASGAIADVNTLLAGLTFTPAAELQQQLHHRHQRQRRRRCARHRHQGHDRHRGQRRADRHQPERRARPTPKTRALNLTDIVVSDVDSANVTVTLTLSNTAAGSLNTGTSGAVTSTYNAGTGVWTASGAIADVNTLLAGVTFTPALNFNSNFTIATSVSDGSPCRSPAARP